MQPIKQFWCGLSGLQLPIPKYQYPEEFQKGSRLTYYASIFNSIEVNDTFYKLPKEATIARWTSDVPTTFHFTFKLLKDVTHCKNFNFNPDDIANFFKLVGHAVSKSGCILIQLPPSADFYQIDKLHELLEQIKISNQEHRWPLAVEFRNASWYNDDTFELLEKFNASLVLQDIGKSASPTVLTAENLVYVRFHGPDGRYGGSYSAEFLAEYAEYVNTWLLEGKQVFVYFNNTKGDAYQNALEFKQLVSKAATSTA